MNEGHTRYEIAHPPPPPNATSSKLATNNGGLPPHQTTSSLNNASEKHNPSIWEPIKTQHPVLDV